MKKVGAGFLVSIMLFAFAGAALAADPVTITIWDFKYVDVTTGVQQAMQKVDEAIMAANPNIKIEHVGQSHDNYYQIIRAAIMAGEGPDVVMLHGGSTSHEFDEYTLELDEYIAPWRDEIPETSWAFCSEGGDGSKPVHMVPITVQGIGMYYNKELFTQAGLDPDVAPNDMESFMAAAETLKAAGIMPITAGAQGGAFTLDFLLRTMVVNIYGPDAPGLKAGTETFTENAAFKRAAEFMQELVDKEYIDPDQGSIPYFFDAANMFAAGKGAMFAGLTSDVCHWKAFNDGLGKESVGYFPSINFPEAKYSDQQNGLPAGIGYTIMKWSKHPDEAMKVIEGYARGEGAAIWMGMTGALSPNTKIDIEKLGYPLVSEILQYPSVQDYTTLLTRAEEDNLRRYCTQFYVSKEISLEKFIESVQSAMDNSRAE